HEAVDLALGTADGAGQLGLEGVEAGDGAGGGVGLGAGGGVGDGRVRLHAGRVAGAERLHGDGGDSGGADRTDAESEGPAGDDVEHDLGSPFVSGTAPIRCCGDAQPVDRAL